ncbi:MAG: extracellular solute-binding protein [Candidatus Hydrogenedentes bacterium]|nr:extracellular solute-binding protein [Candidatus Hydrogenedentota bacterium]
MKRTASTPLILLAALATLAAAGCAQKPSGDAPFAPIDEARAVFWDRQTTETGALMEKIANRFNESNPPLPLKIETTGNYGDIFQKVMASIRAGRLPAMAVSYESMTAQYAASGAALPLDPLIEAPGTGLTPEDLADFFPAVLESNRFSEEGGAMLSFPLTKSVLMLYANHRVLREAGIERPPGTWDEFLGQSRAIKEKTGKHAWAVAVDCSTISAMIFSRGGEVLVGGVPQYDQPASLQTFELLETLVKEDLVYTIPARTFEDEAAFAADRIAFTLRTSAGSANMAIAMGGKNAEWSLNPIPQSDPARPATVLFGPNVTLFDVGADQAASAWGFTRYFTSPEVMAEWCLATGYVPIRRSVARDPRLVAYFEEWPSNRAPFDSLAFARTEPNVRGWQAIRKQVEQAQAAVMSGLQGGREAALALQQAAVEELARGAGQ